MARIRTVKPHIWKDEKVRRLTRDGRLLFVGLITVADDDGRFHALPSIILGDIYPRDKDAPRKLARWLEELERAGLILLYDEEYGCLLGWEKHQKISHRTPSLLPSPSRNGREPFQSRSGGIPE